MDVYITYNYADDEFYYRGTKTIVSHLDMYDNPAWLQPTPPHNFHCTNPTAYGQHPQFAWSAPEEPKGVTFKYKIYRSENGGPFYCVINEWTNRSWTDQEVSIAPKFQGVNFKYYVKAYTDQSPDSNLSNEAFICANPSKAAPDERVTEFDPPDQNPTTFELSALPNPFNPTTTIRYALPQAAPVTLTIYNLKGEVVKTLVNGYQTAQNHQVVWNGDDEAGQKVAAGIYLYQLQAGNYKQTMRLILMK